MTETGFLAGPGAGISRGQRPLLICRPLSEGQLGQALRDGASAVGALAAGLDLLRPGTPPRHLGCFVSEAAMILPVAVSCLCSLMLLWFRPKAEWLESTAWVLLTNQPLGQGSVRAACLRVLSVTWNSSQAGAGMGSRMPMEVSGLGAARLGGQGTLGPLPLSLRGRST